MLNSSRKVLRGKLSQILRFCGYSWKFSLWSLGARYPLAWQKQAICESFFREICFFLPIHKSFLPRKFPAIQYHMTLTIPTKYGFWLQTLSTQFCWGLDWDDLAGKIQPDWKLSTVPEMEPIRDEVRGTLVCQSQTLPSERTVSRAREKRFDPYWHYQLLKCLK